MTRERRQADWDRDLVAGRDAEDYVRALLRDHPAITRIADLTDQPETPDFEFQFEKERVGLEVKSKLQPYSTGYAELWPELHERDLFILDETSLRALSWSEGMGYLLIADVPCRRWVVLGPWHLLLGPHRRFERVGQRTAQTFTKGKLLLDLGIGVSMPDVIVDEVLDIVRQTRATRRDVQPIRLRGQPALPVIPKPPLQSTVVEEQEVPTGNHAAAATTPVQDVPPRDPEASDAWCGLTADLTGALKVVHGWNAPTEIQRSAIPHVLAGRNTLVLAPTAGGKTEAALLPLLDLAQRERWRPTSVLAVSPMKALLDDQLRRYQALGALTGASAFAWHGDTPTEARRHFLNAPSDILLTTPESLEILLHRSDARDVLSGIQAVIIDEVHAFVGTTRGAQLAAMLERLDDRTETELQRVGLSATVGTPDDVLGWLRGSSYREAHVATVSGSATREATSIVSYESEAELAVTLQRVLTEQRTLVFVQSRRRAEQLGSALDLPVHHSSLSAPSRTDAIQRFRDGEVRGIVATATLELGIDIGDVELVVQDAAPSGPASYLQRVGRSGRRTGTRRALFTCSSPDDLLQVLSVLARVRRGALEPLPVQRGARLMLGQQALALALDPTRTGMERHELASTICYSRVFRDLEGDALATVDHLVANDWLVEIRGLFIAGGRTNLEFGSGPRNFAKLAASFDTRASLAVVAEDGTFVGTIDWSAAQDDKALARGEPFRLGGKAWSAVEVTSEVVRVVPARTATAAKAPSWRGPTLDVDRATWETAREILSMTEVPAALDQRGCDWLEALRAAWAPKLRQPVSTSSTETMVATFAGAGVHRAVLRALEADGAGDGPELRIANPGRDELRVRARSAIDQFEMVVTAEAEHVAATLGGRHRELLPESVLRAEAVHFGVDGEGIRHVLALLAEN